MYALTKKQDSILKSIVAGYIDQEVTGGQYADELIDLLYENIDNSDGYHNGFDEIMAIQAFREIDSEEDTDEEYTIYAEVEGSIYNSEWQNYSFLKRYPVPKGTRIGIEIAYSDKVEFILDAGVYYG